jgi:hypothetical protein
MDIAIDKQPKKIATKIYKDVLGRERANSWNGVMTLPIQLPLRGWIGLMLMMTTGFALCAASVGFYGMLDAVNARRKIEPEVGFWEPRYMKRETCSDYAAFYLNGPLLKRYRVRVIVGVAAVVGAVICFVTS